jgi:hypothetical protein
MSTPRQKSDDDWLNNAIKEASTQQATQVAPSAHHDEDVTSGTDFFDMLIAAQV